MGIAHSFVFRTHRAPDTVVYFELSILPRALPSSEEAMERATSLFLAFQEFGQRAPPQLGMSWHVTPEADGQGGFGTRVEVLGQWMGTEEEYEVVIKDFEDLCKEKGVGHVQRGQRSLSELSMLIPVELVVADALISVPAIDAQCGRELDRSSGEGAIEYQ